jgi:nitrate/TMAO reductase-like tetraheme cytochrome c subunit
LKFSFGYTSASAIMIVALIILLLNGAWIAQEIYTSDSDFCGGSCHTMAEQFSAWKGDKHHASNNAEGKQAECIECHFLPGEKQGIKAKLEGLRHLAAYLYDPQAPLPIRPVIKDGACLQSGCHAIDDFQERELQFTEKVRFKHTPHLGDNALQGQKLTCDSCHVKVTAEKHFEVPQEICFLCHLMPIPPRLEQAAIETTSGGETGPEAVSFKQRPAIDFSQGVSKCDTCHVIPTRSLQSQLSDDDPKVKAITHQTLQTAGVACEGCHIGIVAGAGEVSTGSVVSGGCLTCHNSSDELLATATNGKLMHDEHIATPRADCFDCHSVIEHRNRTDHLDFVRQDCSLCHQDQHRYQKVLLAGMPIAERASATPNLMFDVNTNCMGCHLNSEFSKGHTVKNGAPEACAACHTPEHKQMLADWNSQVTDEVAYAEEIETQALQALARIEGKLDAAKLKEAAASLAAGQAYLNIVRLGNGVHNKKYSIKLIDEAITKFEDTIDLLADGE